MPEIKIQNRNIMGLPTDINYWGIAETTFKYSDYLQALADETSESFSQKSTLNYYIKEVNSWTRTPNDDAWTNNYILTYENALENLNTDIESIKANWQQAVEAFQGKLEMDATQMPGYEEVKEAVDAYNAAVAAFIEAREAYETYGEENLLAWEIYYDARGDAEQARNDAKNANLQEFNETMAAAYQKIEQAEINMKNTDAAYQKAKAEYELIETPTAEQTAALEKARQDAVNAQQAYNTACTTEYYETQREAEELQRKKDAVADADYQVAEAAAWENYKKNQANDAAIQEKSEELREAVYGEEGAYNKLKNAYDEAGSTYYSYYDEMSLLHSNEYLLEEAFYHWDDNVWIPQEVDAVALAEVYRDEVQNYIERLSYQLFGKTDRLVELSVDEMKAEIEQEYMERYPDADFVPFASVIGQLYRYGMVGRAAYCQALIDIAKATLENEEAIEALKAELNDHLAAVNEIIAKAAEEAASAEWAYTQADEALQAKFADIDKKIEEAEALKYAVKPVIDKVAAAIKTYLSYEDKDAETLADLKKTLNDALVEAEGEMYDAETALLKAQERQKKYANEEANAVTIAQEDLAEAEKDLQEAQDELTAANEALLAEIDRISEQNEEVAE